MLPVLLFQGIAGGACEARCFTYACFLSGVLYGKTVLLAANHLASSILQSPYISGVIVVNGGRVTQYSSYGEASKRRDTVYSLSSQSSEFSHSVLVGDCTLESAQKTHRELRPYPEM